MPIEPLTSLSSIRAALNRGPDQRERATVDYADRNDTVARAAQRLDVRPLSPANIARLFLPPFGLLKGSQPPGGTAKARSIRVGDEVLAYSDGPAYDVSRIPQAAQAPRPEGRSTLELLEEREDEGVQDLLERVRQRNAASVYERDDEPKMFAPRTAESAPLASALSKSAIRAYEASSSQSSGVTFGWPSPSTGVPQPRRGSLLTTA